MGSRQFNAARMRAPVAFVALAAFLALAAFVASPALARSRTATPFGVSAAAVSQSGQQLTWRVALDHRFSPAGLRDDRRTLCLVLRRATSTSVFGVLCVAPGRRAPQLVFSRVSARGRGPGRGIAATVTRSSASDLSASFLPSAVGLPYQSFRWQVLNTAGSGACSGSHPPAGCSSWFPARAALTRLHTPVPVGCVPSGPAYSTNGSRSVRQVAMTFDDGPWPDTPQFLDILERQHVPATFFQIGSQEAQYGAVDRRILADGDIIGDHTETHADVAGGGPFAAGQISAAAAAIRRASGFNPCLFRAPGGAVSSSLISLAASMGFKTIEWDVDPRDWSRPGTAAIYGNVVANARNGSIILQHDGGGDRSETLAALPREIANLRSRGFRFVTVTQLLGLRVIYK